MESAKQERKNLMKDMPIDKRASGGSWMSKHSQSRIGGSPVNLKETPVEMKEKEGMMMKDAPTEMSPMEKELSEKQKAAFSGGKNPGLEAAIEAAPEMKYKK